MDPSQEPETGALPEPAPQQPALGAGEQPPASSTYYPYSAETPPPPGGWQPPPGGYTLDAEAPPPPRGPRWGRRAAALLAGVALLLGVGLAGYHLGSPGSGTTASQPIPTPASSGVTSRSSTLDVAKVTAKVEPAVVDITATDGYQNTTDAGTGIVLTSNGEVLTNNHVIDGATSITAQVDGQGTKYAAKVIGYDDSQDVALIQLEDASGLSTATVGNSSNVSVGDAVVAIGNALDLPGKPTVTSGQVTALDRSITASDDGSDASENLTGLIQINASICPGNSGGPLADAAGQVIGMNTAAAEQGSSDSCSTVGFSIPINTALSMASQIQKGESSSNVHIGLPGFIGVEVENASQAGQGGFGGFGGYTAPTSSGALITSVLNNTPAQSAGLQAGDVITAIGGTSVASVSALSSAIAGYQPGQSISLTYVNSSGSSHTVSLTLITGPAG